MLRAGHLDSRPQIPEPSSAWQLTGQAFASGGELILPAMSDRGWSPLFPVHPSRSVVITGEVIVPAGGSDRWHIETQYFAADRKTPASNGANMGNGNAASPPTLGEWSALRWGVTLGPDIHWVRFGAVVSPQYGTLGTRYRNLRITLTR